jgi:PAS domain S-box-containing protein
MRTASGAYKWLLDRGRVVERDVNGAPRKVIGISIDIDARKRAEEALRDSELRLRAVIDAAPVPFALNDEDGNITFLNAMFVRIFGYLPSEIPTLTDWWMRAYPDPAYRQWVKETWAGRLDIALKTDAAFEPMEVVIRCKDGSDRTVIAYASPLSPLSPLAGTSARTHLVVLLDVTEQRLLEQKILAAVDEEQNRIGMDLHDGLGQQLTGLSLMLIALAHKARMGHSGSTATELEALAGLASECVANARAISHGLLPIESGRGGFERALRRLAESTQKTTALKVTLSLLDTGHLELEQPVAGPLFRIAQEALTNAAKHSGASRVRIKVQHAAGTLTLTVSDDGRGFREEEVAAGLGLGIMRHRARALGGRIEIGRSKSGGTLVRCTCRVGTSNNIAPSQ